jgi:hypothetical protein
MNSKQPRQIQILPVNRPRTRVVYTGSMQRLFFHVVLATLALGTFSLKAQTPIDPTKATAAFAEAQEVSNRDGGRLWGKPLYGPMLFVDPGTRAVVTNVPDADGALHPDHGVYTGNLPKDLPIANTAMVWAGTHWTMILWPLPQDTLARRRLMSHELFHRLQDGLHLPANNPSNAQLDSLNGRLWIQLEWRALAAALLASGPAQTRAIEDALAFRSYRQSLFPGSHESERALDLNEGLAEYTGVVASMPDNPSARWRAVTRLAAPSTSDTFVRSFSYISVPAYGLLLDARQPGWRKHLTATSDLATLLSATVSPLPQSAAEAHAAGYGLAALRYSETERSSRAEAARAHYRQSLMDGPTLVLPAGDKFNYSFNPNEIVPLGDAGNVYPIMQATDDWGSITVEDGALFGSGHLSVTAPTSTTGSHIVGAGYTLDLNPGWQVVPGSRAGSFTVKHL